MVRSFILMLCVACGATQASSHFSRVKSYSLILRVTMDYNYSNSLGDQVSGATYGSRFANSYVGDIGLGTLLFSNAYVGAVFENRYARRSFTLAGQPQIDTLNFKAVGGEIGYWSSNPRTYLLFSGGTLMSLSPQITSEGESQRTFSGPSGKLIFFGKVTMGIRLWSWFSFNLVGGYRHSNLGAFSSGSDALLSGSESLDISGPFGGVGLSIHY